MAATDRARADDDPSFDPDDPKFAPLRAALGRLFLQHKAALGMLDWSDDEIIARVNDICAALMVASTHAAVHGDRAWMARHKWFADACERLFNDQPAVELDG